MIMPLTFTSKTVTISDYLVVIGICDLSSLRSLGRLATKWSL
jgi:hypothetical protein